MSSTLARAHVLVLGSGGREHALAWAMAQMPSVGKVSVYPGNAATREVFGILSGGESDLGALTPAGFPRLADWALAAHIDLVLVGPDAALADGVTDVLTARGLRVFGPTREAARLESSKEFGKDVMQAAKIPTARFRVVEMPAAKFSDVELAKVIADVTEGESPDAPGAPGANGAVVKLDGLALGKGVVVCEDFVSVTRAVHDLAEMAQSGGDTAEIARAPVRLVIEERLVGEELSWFALCDGSGVYSLGGARDHKRLRDGDQGPNTGGMGVISPVPGFPESEWGPRLEREVFEPARLELKRRGITYRGVMFAGLMVGASSAYWVLEFNARFGDPETQALMPRIVNGGGDLYPALLACAEDRLAEWKVGNDRSLISESRSGAAAVVVGAARGYPVASEKNQVLPVVNWARPEKFGLANSGANTGTLVFAAGVARSGSQWVSQGGRVLNFVGVAPTTESALGLAYSAAEAGKFSGMQFRSDIGRGSGGRSRPNARGRSLNSKSVPVPVAILASGRGSNFDAIADAIVEGALRAKIVGVFSDRADAAVIEKAKSREIPTQIISPSTDLSAALDAIDRTGAMWIILAGFMRILPDAFIDHYRDERGFSRVINIHPSLLPKYKGKNGYGQAFAAGEKEAGVSVHLVEPELDSGPICAQESFSIRECRSVEEVEALGLAIEHRLYAETLEKIFSEGWPMKEMKDTKGDTRVHSS